MIFYHQRFSHQYSAKAIYGIILIQALLIGLDTISTKPFEVATKTFVGALVIVFAEIYSQFLGGIINKKGHLSKKEIEEIKREALSVSAVSINPTILFLISSFGLISLNTAFNIAYLFGLLELIIFGFIASRSIHSDIHKNIRAALFTGLVGFSIIAAKSFIH